MKPPTKAQLIEQVQTLTLSRDKYAEKAQAATTRGQELEKSLEDAKQAHKRASDHQDRAATCKQLELIAKHRDQFERFQAAIEASSHAHFGKSADIYDQPSSSESTAAESKFYNTLVHLYRLTQK